MGYQAVDCVQGFNFTAPTFKSLNSSIDIQDIQLQFTDTAPATGGDNLQLLDEGGAVTETYYWFPKDWMYPVPEKDGWSDSNTGGIATKTILPGQGFIVDAISDETKIVYAGQVSTETTSVSDTVTGFNWTGNITPSEIDIQKIQLVFNAEAPASGGDNIQLLDAGGAVTDTYYWFPKDWMYPIPEKDGWSDSNTGGIATKSIAPGQGFLIDIISAGTKIVLPAGYTPAAQ